jgi:biopolymer transport protein ExbD
MVSTSFTDLSELVVNLPEADGEQRQAEAKGLELVITSSEEMFLNGVPFPADEKNLRLILVEKAGSRRDIPISIIADADTRHAMVVMSMDTVSQLGFKQLSIGTQKPLSGD